jgi:hypothetical protein
MIDQSHLGRDRRSECWAERDAPVEAAIEVGDLERAQELRLEIWAPLGTSDERGAKIRRIAFDNIHEILMVETEHDPPDMHRIADFLVREIIGARKVVVEGADQVVNLRQPERFEELVLDFLAASAPS